MIDWYGCYDERWQGILVPEAMAHPAKFAAGLLVCLLDYGLEQGWWQPGSVIGDPFGGVACGGIVAAYRGLRWVGVELEERFCSLAKLNIEKHRRVLEAMGDPVPVIIQGDSRRFHELIAAEAIVTSPPYVSGGHHPDQTGAWNTNGRGQGQGKEIAGYGVEAGQIGRLPAGDLDSILTSPPYAQTNIATDPEAELRRLQAKAGTGELGREMERLAKKGELSPNSNLKVEGYGSTAGQIGELPAGGLDAVVTSPPFRDARSETTKSKPGKDGACLERFHTVQAGPGYGETEGQIDNLQTGDIDAVVTSPPYAANEKSDYRLSEDGKTRARDEKRGYRQGAGGFRGSETYGDTEGQIGRERKETYWEAMALVYRSCYEALKPGGYACIVVKDYVQRKQRVALCDQTMRLLESVGFVAVERIRCWLVTEAEEPCLFGGKVTKKKERKSFFRKIYEKKYPGNNIDWEEILVVRKE